MKGKQVRIVRGITGTVLAIGLWLASAAAVHADIRHFTYSYEADSVMPEGRWEFEQWLTNKGGKADGVYSRWDVREEFEYGLTERLTSALYFNLRNTYSDGVTGVKDANTFRFRGISSEWKYMLLSPHLYPVGVLPYFEVRYSGEELELEEKLILSHAFKNRASLAFNANLAQEWKYTGSGTEEEAELELTAGASWPLSQHWAVGLEGRNHREFPGNTNFSGTEEHSAWFLGPNVHYESEKRTATLTILPQVAGRPATWNGLQLAEHEKMEVRLIASILF